jgi:hypothetical protein
MSTKGRPSRYYELVSNASAQSFSLEAYEYPLGATTSGDTSASSARVTARNAGTENSAQRSRIMARVGEERGEEKNKKVAQGYEAGMDVCELPT